MLDYQFGSHHNNSTLTETSDKADHRESMRDLLKPVEEDMLERELASNDQ